MDLNEVKESINLQDFIAGELGRPAKRGGQAHFWTCPFHADGQTPSLAVYADHWNCFGCGAHGDVVTWIMKRRNMPFKDALAELKIDPTSRPAKPVQRGAEIKRPPCETWQETGTAFYVECWRRLWEPAMPSANGGPDRGANARKYLFDRGLTEETCVKAMIGFNDKARFWPAEEWGLNPTRVKQVFMPMGLTIPHVHDDTNTLWGIKVRQPRGVDPKYIHAAGSIPDLYGAETLTNKEAAVICEGEFDALLLRQQVGDLVGVATYGAATSRDLDTWLPYLVNAKTLLIATDNDAAGEEAWAWWAEKTRRASRALPPGGVKDLTDAHLAGNDLRAWVEGLLL
jgi:DNA primase